MSSILAPSAHMPKKETRGWYPPEVMECSVVSLLFPWGSGQTSNSWAEPRMDGSMAKNRARWQYIEVGLSLRPANPSNSI